MFTIPENVESLMPLIFLINEQFTEIQIFNTCKCSLKSTLLRVANHRVLDIDVSKDVTPIAQENSHKGVVNKVTVRNVQVWRSQSFSVVSLNKKKNKKKTH